MESRILNSVQSRITPATKDGSNRACLMTVIYVLVATFKKLSFTYPATRVLLNQHGREVLRRHAIEKPQSLSHSSFAVFGRASSMRFSRVLARLARGIQSVVGGRKYSKTCCWLDLAAVMALFCRRKNLAGQPGALLSLAFGFGVALFAQPLNSLLVPEIDIERREGFVRAALRALFHTAEYSARDVVVATGIGL